RLADGAEQAQARQVVVLGSRLGRYTRRPDQRSDRGRRRVEDVDLMLLDGLPEATGVGVSRDTFEDDRRRADRKRPIVDVRVPGDPADIGRAPEDVRRLDVEDPAHRQYRPQQIAAGAVLYALGCPSRSRGVKNE